jgi:hypothetical protein
MRKFAVSGIIGFLLLVLTALALAGSKTVQVKPFIFDPEESGLMVAAWVTHQGLPDVGNSAHALMLQISPAPIDPPAEGTKPTFAPAATLAKVGLVIKGIKGLTITELGFDIRKDGFFTAGPRFEVYTDSGVFTFPLSASNQVSIDGTDWKRVRFDPSSLKVIGSSVVQSVTIIFDEEGTVLLDNIDFNGTLMGKPGNTPLKVAPQSKVKK